MGQAERIAKVEETNRIATQIIEAEAFSRRAKTEKLREARLSAESASPSD